jgi:NADPH:quinone reductase-like Zn-dependent oxidoreductase
MGTREELRQLVALLESTGLRPRIDSTLPLAETADGIAAMIAGDVFGKIVIRP